MPARTAPWWADRAATFRPHRVRALSFDWGDTLAASTGMPYDYIIRQALLSLGRDLESAGGQAPADWPEPAMAELERLYQDTIDLDRNPEQREFDYPGLVLSWIRRFGAVEAAVRIQALRRYFDTCTDAVRPFGGVTEALARLKDLGYRLGILSHVPWDPEACRAWFKRWGLAGNLDFYSLSSEVGWIKPNHLHYQDALAQAACAADELLHVGDHPLRDIRGAKSLGIRTCLRLTERLHPPAELADCAPDLVIGHVEELPALLGPVASPP